MLPVGSKDSEDQRGAPHRGGGGQRGDRSRDTRREMGASLGTKGRGQWVSNQALGKLAHWKQSQAAEILEEPQELKRWGPHTGLRGLGKQPGIVRPQVVRLTQAAPTPTPGLLPPLPFSPPWDPLPLAPMVWSYPNPLRVVRPTSAGAREGGV